jgi:hypothetical protein
MLTDFFVASSSELESVFHGWARPAPLLDDFVTRTIRNPFTRVTTTVRSRIPDSQPEAAPGAIENPDVSSFDLLDQKGLSITDLVMLARALMDWEEDNASSEIKGRIFAGPPEAEGVLVELPEALTKRLAILTV